MIYLSLCLIFLQEDDDAARMCCMCVCELSPMTGLLTPEVGEGGGCCGIAAAGGGLVADAAKLREQLVPPCPVGLQLPAPPTTVVIKGSKQP